MKKQRKKAIWQIAAIGFAGMALMAVRYVMTPSRAELEQRAVDAISRKDLSAAEAALLQISPRDEEVLRLLADLAYGQGRKKDCIHWLERWAESSSQKFDGLCEAGAKAFEFARPLDAERIYRRAMQIAPNALEPYRRLSRLYLACHRGDDLRQLIADADRLNINLIDDPSLLWFWIVGDRVDWYEEDSRRWLESVSIEQPEDEYSAAALILSSTEPNRTDITTRITIRTSSKSQASWALVLTRASAELDDDRVEDSLETLRKLPSEGDRHAQTWFLRGRLAVATGDDKSALTAFEYATQLDPLFVAARYQRGHLLNAMGQSPDADVQLHLALRIDDLVQRTVRLLQSTQRNTDDLIAIASLAQELGQERWAQWVCKLIESSSKNVNWPAPLASIRSKPIPALTLPNPGHPPRFALPESIPTHTPRPRSTPVQEYGNQQIRFIETTRELNLNFGYEYGHSQEHWLMETLGGGVAVLDYDHDGWPDLFFAQGGTLSPKQPESDSYGQLRRNDRGIKLSDTTAEARALVRGYSHGCAVGDVNEDGFSDLLVCRYGGVTLLINEGDGTWRESPTTGLSAEPRWYTSAALADLDQDGDLDIYLAGYCHAPMSNELRTCREGSQFVACRPSAYPVEPDALLINTGTGRFEDKSETAGIHDDSGYGLGVVVADFDQDGLSEIFVGNDTTQNFLWHRASPSESPLERRYFDSGLAAGVAVDGNGRAEACMGIACGDVDGDQQLDLFVTNFFDETCTFYQNLGSLQFEDRTQHVGLSNAGRRLMGWGCQFVDADNDGWLDLIILNGHLHDTPQLPQLYRNQMGRFTERSANSGPYFQQRRLGRSLATWDYNRDGKVDVVVSHQTEPAAVLKNDSDVGHRLKLTLVGTRSVRDATGTVIRARVGNRQIVRLVSTQGGYLSACSSDIILGMATSEIVESFEIEWPSGTHTKLSTLRCDQHLLIREGDNIPIELMRDGE